MSLEAKLDEAVVRLHLSWGLRGPGPQSRLKACALGGTVLWEAGRQGGRESRLLPFLSLWALGPPLKEEPCQSAMLVPERMAEEACSPGFWGWEAFQNSASPSQGLGVIL